MSPAAARRSRALWHFFAIGAGLLLLQNLWPQPPPVLVIRDTDVRQLTRQWQADTGQPPTATQLRASLRRYAEQQMLLAEAFRLGLDREDPVVRERLLGNLQFIDAADAATAGDASSRLAQARRLGMDRSDPVVRRRLVQLMERRLMGSHSLTQAELDAYVRAHAAAYTPPARSDLQLIFISRDRHGARSEALAQQWLAQARAGQPPAGDPFLLGSTLKAQSAAQLRAQFGAPLAQAAAQATPGVWYGPYASAYGLHLLRVDPQAPPAAADLAALRQQLRYRLLHERETQALQAALRALWSRYQVQWPDSVRALAS